VRNTSSTTTSCVRLEVASRNTQPARATSDGIGYSHIRKGSGTSGRDVRSTCRATIWLTNCIGMRIVTAASTSICRSRKQQATTRPPKDKSETCG
jgi:hypothetical protein